MLRRSQRSVCHAHAISISLLLDRRKESIRPDELAMRRADEGNLGGEGGEGEEAAHPLVNTFSAEVLPQAPSPLSNTVRTNASTQLESLTATPSCAGRPFAVHTAPL